MADVNDKKPRGRDATSPSEIPPIGWKDVALRTWSEVQRDRVGFLAAGIAFYLLFALVPGLAALISVYGLVADPADVAVQITNLRGVVPANTVDLIESELTTLTSENEAVGWGLVVSLAVTLYSGSKAVAGIMTGLNIACGERDKRGFFKQKLLAVGLTFGSVVFLAIVLTLLVAVPVVLKFAGFGDHSEAILDFIRWPVLGVVAMSWIAVLYRVAPDRRPARWRWVTWGSALAVLVWFLISIGLSIYAASFADLSKTYGSLGAIVLLLLWFYGFGWAVLAGAELNAEIERQTSRDSTTGPPKPMGERGAFAADSLGEVP